MRKLWIVNGTVCMDRDGIVIATNPTAAEVAAAVLAGRVVRN